MYISSLRVSQTLNCFKHLLVGTFYKSNSNMILLLPPKIVLKQDLTILGKKKFFLIRNTTSTIKNAILTNFFRKIL